MAVTTGTKTLTYPNSGVTDWYSIISVMFQDITDYLDDIESNTAIVNDTTPELGADLNVSTYSLVDTNGNELISFTPTVSAINYLTIGNAATGAAPTITAVGDDTNVDLNLSGKGTGSLNPTSIAKLSSSNLNVNANNFVDTNGNEILGFGQTTGAVNYVKFTNAATGNGPTIESVGDDINIDLAFAAKGTGSFTNISDFETTGTVTFSSNEVYEIGDVTNFVRRAYIKGFTFDGGTNVFDQDSLNKAWVTYDHPAATNRDSSNVSSVTDVSTGKFTVNFTDAFDNAEYVMIGVCDNSSTGSNLYHTTYRLPSATNTTSAAYLHSKYMSASTDPTLVDRHASVSFVGSRG